MLAADGSCGYYEIIEQVLYFRKNGGNYGKSRRNCAYEMKISEKPPFAAAGFGKWKIFTETLLY